MGPRFARLLEELRSPPSETDALRRLRILRRGPRALALGEGTEGRSLDELRDEEADVVDVMAGVYASVPTREARVRVLRLLRQAAPVVSLHAAIADDGTHLGRVAIDGPRRLLRAARLPVAEPGDRLGSPGFVHCFFDEEELLGEIASAGLRVAARKSFRFELVAQAEPLAEDADAFALELLRVVPLVPGIDRGRNRESPAQILAAVRARGIATARVRGPIGRARLRRAIGWIDALRGASCYRRILLESALDAGAARETVVFGLDVGRTGHVAFEDREERTFDVSFAIPDERQPP